MIEWWDMIVGSSGMFRLGSCVTCAKHTCILLEVRIKAVKPWVYTRAELQQVPDSARVQSKKCWNICNEPSSNKTFWQSVLPSRHCRTRRCVPTILKHPASCSGQELLASCYEFTCYLCGFQDCCFVSFFQEKKGGAVGVLLRFSGTGLRTSVPAPLHRHPTRPSVATTFVKSRPLCVKSKFVQYLNMMLFRAFLEK